MDGRSLVLFLMLGLTDRYRFLLPWEPVLVRLIAACASAVVVVIIMIIVLVIEMVVLNILAERVLGLSRVFLLLVLLFVWLLVCRIVWWALLL